MAFDPNKITYFGKTDARGKNVMFGIKAKDRQRHIYVIGKTGMGKSTLLENMAVQDIQNGEGMAFIDPHGSAAETLLKYIPEHRVKDVLYFAPFDAQHPVSFNVMEDVGPEKRHLVVSGLMSVFKKIWVDAWSARMEYILQNTILALLEYPGSTLLGVNRMLSDKDYRKLVVDNIKDPSVRSFWVDEFAKYNERYMQEAGDAIKNKIGQFTANPIIRNIVGQSKSSFDIRKIMDEKKILIMNLSKGLIGESNANLLGSMLTTRIYLAAMSRADLSPEKMREMPNFYFYVDEFQSFANATFANILSEARKYHLNLTIAHQYIEQMEEEVRNAVFGNVGTIIAFRVGPFDAEVLETIFTPQFLAADIVNLGFAQVYLTLMIDGIGSPPFSATTLPPIPPPTISYRDVVVAHSRKQFTRLRSDVEIDIIQFHQPVVLPKKQEQQPRNDEQKARPKEQAPNHGGEQKPAQVPNRSRDGEVRRDGRPDRKEDNNQRRKENGNRPPQQKPVDKSTELRSVLERIAVPKEKPAEPKKELKDVLRAVLPPAQETKEVTNSNTPQTETTPAPTRTHNNENQGASVVSEPERKAVETLQPVVPTVQEAVSAPVTRRENPQPHPRPHAHVEHDGATQTEEKSTKVPISPKKLERMMRVTVHDTPPV